MRKLIYAGVVLCFGLSVAQARSPLEIRSTHLTQTALSTDVKVEFLVRNITGPIFIRLRCEVSDADGKSLGVYSQDFSSGVPYQPLTLPTGSFQRPTLNLHPVEGADHASCAFATADDPLPVVSPSDVVAELDSVRSIHIINRSGYQIARVAFQCRGPEGSFSYELGEGG
jgi:hypothetical protein